MLPDNQEKAFKNLIQSTGYESTPESLLSSVLTKLESEQLSQTSLNSALISKWVWAIIIVGLISSTAYILNIQEIEFQLLRDMTSGFSIPKIDLLWFPSLNFGTMTTLIVCSLLPAIFLQFYFIKNYYENSI